MPGRRKSRQRALQILFYRDLRKVPVDQAIREFYDDLYAAELEEETGEDVDIEAIREPFVESLVRGTVDNLDTLDRLIEQRAEHWRLERMPIVDRNILRMAIYELMHCADVPPKVAINEAIELGKKFSTANSGGFVNGILDRVRMDLEKERAAAKGQEAPGT